MIPAYNRKLLFLLMLSVFSVACSETSPNSNSTATPPRALSAEEMEVPIKIARASFDEFKTRFRYPEKGDAGFSVKVKIVDGENIEHMWLIDIDLESSPFEGTIGNEPFYVSNVSFGERYLFTLEDLSDWMYISNGVVQGNYTIRVSMETMSPEEVASLKELFGW